MAGTNSGGRRGRRKKIVGINVTPMVDVVLVLLVIMMVSAMYIVSQSLKVQLPKTATSDESVNSTAKVTIAKGDILLFNGKRVDEPALVNELRGAYRASSEVNLVVSADREVQHGSVVHVIDLAKIEGITKFAINVERSN